MTVGKMLNGYILWQSPKPYWPFSDHLDPKHSHLMTMLGELNIAKMQSSTHQYLIPLDPMQLLCRDTVGALSAEQAS